MLLAVDAGNSQTQIGLFSKDLLVADWRTRTQPGATADELALTLQQFLSLKDLSFSQLTGMVTSSVVPSVTGALRQMAEGYLHFPPVVVEPGLRTGMRILIDNPLELGADRLCGALAAHALVGGPVIVVDFGTATTFDAVSHRGEYLGGAICPGVQVAADALAAATARLPRVELMAPRSAIGRSTVESLRSGVILGAAAMVEGMVARIQSEMTGEAQVVATGGLCSLVLEHCSVKARFEPSLTLTGLRLLYERNVR